MHLEPSPRAMGYSVDDRRLMGRALELAARALYTAHPNPRVGCVIARAGRVVGEGFHTRAGTPHAEINALAAAGSAARGATAYVTLEPCCHSGRTGPCTEALREAGIARVVAAMRDPDPRVAGGGIAALEAAGVDVDCGLMSEEARALNPGFLSRHERGRPLVRLKLAMSLDGRTALANGRSRWITDVAARRDVQRFRARSDAIVTGVGTVLDDDPQLTVRAADLDDEARALGAGEVQRLRVIVDSRLRTPPTARVLATGPVAIATAASPHLGAGRYPPQVRILALPAAGGRVALDALLAALVREPVNEVWLEAGARLAGAFLAAALVDELIVYCAPKLLGPAARPLADLAPIARMDDALELEFVDVATMGRDLRIVARPRRT